MFLFLSVIYIVCLAACLTNKHVQNTNMPCSMNIDNMTFKLNSDIKVLKRRPPSPAWLATLLPVTQTTNDVFYFSFIHVCQLAAVCL